ncbi:UDP-glucose 4-epimerase GalE [Desulfobacter vibrioformis]|uniref:UDP-glucose 4-epimerase GalE n=1 Tax=Desulfobacter vibrioformis TaxID=34031 RepID=UPI001FDF3209|nr:UDP-glucose 4-epimerase GalE [Desulfobacter vibrioformis]
MTSILVTGGAGYIGSHTCKILALHGYTPVVLDNLVHGHEWAVNWGPLVVGDLSSREVLDRVFKVHNPSAVIHLAAFAYVGESVIDPSKYYTNNVICALNLLDAMRRHACEKIVFSSTCAVYGTPECLPLSESHPCGPINPYGRSKRFIEQIMADYGKAYGLRHASLRYFNAAGADPEGQLGEDHDPETHLIPLALKASLPGAMPLTVFGTDWDTPDGTCIRDYIHVVDLAEAHLAALHYLDTHPCCTFNLGNGNGHSVKKIIDTVEKVTGRPVNWETGPRRAGDPSRLVADAFLAKQKLGWTPCYQDITDIIGHAWQWMAKHKRTAT